MNKKFEKLIRQSAWHYPQAGNCWQDGLFLGNGNIGVLAYAPQHLEWVFNKVDVFDPTVEEAMMAKILPHDQVMKLLACQEHKNSMFLQELESAPMQRSSIRNTISTAKMRLRFWPGLGWAAPPAPLTEQTLSLYDGVLQENLDSHNFHVQTEMLAARDSGVFALNIENDSSRRQMFVLELIRPSASFLSPAEWFSSDGTTAFRQLLPGGKHSYAVAVKIVPHTSGTVNVPRNIAENAVSISGSGSADIFVAIKSSLECKDPLSAAVDEAQKFAGAGFEQIKQQHTAWWHNYWDNAYADFGKYRDVQKYYTFSLYEIASCYGKAPMPGLNGLFYGPVNEENPGVSFQAYTHDQNVQIPAMPFFPLNRTKLVEVIADTYLQNIKTLRKQTRKLFNSPGIYLPLQMNQLGREYPVRHYRYTLCGSAYSGLILAMAWKYSRDVNLLKNKLYPLLREFAIFYASMMHKSPQDECYHLDWSVPPEIFTFTRDEAATVAMLKVVLEVLLETSCLLKRDSRNRKLWQDILEHYPAIPMTPDGALWAGKDIPLNHYFYGGHILYAYFPAGITDDGSVARKTLELIANESVERSFADHTGKWHPNHEWSMFLQTAARLFMGDRQTGWQGVERFLELFGKENGLFSHDPVLIMPDSESEKNEKLFRNRKKSDRRWIDGSLIDWNNPELPYAPTVTPNKNAKRLAPGVLEGSSAFLYLASAALLQSRNGVIKVFPGVPEDFSGEFEKMLAENALEVSAKIRRGKVTQVKIHAIYNGSYKLLNPFASTPMYLTGKLHAGETALFRREQ